MKKEVIFSVTLSLLTITEMTDASSSSIIVQPGPVKVKQGNDVTLWCEVKQLHLDMLKRRVYKRMVPVIWQRYKQSDATTLTANCVAFDGKKYGISCGESPWWYNMTIKDVQWADKGKYRCMHTRHRGIVNLKVWVLVREVSLTYTVSGSTSKPLFLSMGTDAMLTCKTDCASPAPKISWYKDAQPFKGSATVTRTEVGCSGEKQGQRRTISIITVRGKYVEKERKEEIISCEARNIIGEERPSKAIVVTYGDPCENVLCPPARVCELTSKNHAVCVCGPPDICNGHHKQVCGDDGIMYSSHCELHRTGCIKDKHIGVAHTNTTCKPEATRPSPTQPLYLSGFDTGGIAIAIVGAVLIGTSIVIVIVIVCSWKKVK